MNSDSIKSYLVGFAAPIFSCASIAPAVMDLAFSDTYTSMASTVCCAALPVMGMLSSLWAQDVRFTWIGHCFETQLANRKTNICNMVQAGVLALSCLSRPATTFAQSCIKLGRLALAVTSGITSYCIHRATTDKMTQGWLFNSAAWTVTESISKLERTAALAKAKAESTANWVLQLGNGPLTEDEKDNLRRDHLETKIFKIDANVNMNLALHSLAEMADIAGNIYQTARTENEWELGEEMESVYRRLSNESSTAYDLSKESCRLAENFIAGIIQNYDNRHLA